MFVALLRRDRAPRWRRRRWPSSRSTTGITPGDVGALNLVVVAFLVSALVCWGATSLQTYLVGWVGQRVLQDLRVRSSPTSSACRSASTRASAAGVLISRHDQRRRGARPARHRRRRDAVPVDADADRDDRDPVLLDAKLALLTFLVFPLLLVGALAFRIASADAYRLTREKIAWITAYLQETLSGVRVVRAFGQERRHDERFAELNEENREANMRTVYLNAAYFPAVELRLGAGDRRDPALRRLSGDRRPRHGRRAGRRSSPR